MQALTEVDLELIRELLARDEFFWLDLDDPDDASMRALAEVLRLHELAVEDTREFAQRPKVESYGSELLLVYYGARMTPERRPVAVEVHLHVSGSFVVSVHRDRCPQFDAVREQFHRAPPGSEEVVVYRVIDALTDSILEVLDQVADQVEEYEAEIFRRPRARDRDRMASLRRSLGALRRLLVTQRHGFPRVVEQILALPRLERDVTAYYRDVEDHLARALDEVDAARESLQGMLDTYSNEVQERLTIVATIFLPLTVITGFFGQNFGWMINRIGATWAFWGLGVGGLAVSVATIMLWLWRSGLYHGPD
jgi:magnesium transporter